MRRWLLVLLVCFGFGLGACDASSSEDEVDIEALRPKAAEVTDLLAKHDTPLTFERGEMRSRVSFHANGEIAGLFLLAPGEG